MLDTLRYRDFRLIWIATLLSTSSRWMELLAGGWLMLYLTDSPFMVGVASAFRTVGWIFGPLAGVAADRIDRRKLLVLAQSANIFQSAVLLALVLTGNLQVWEVFALAFINGIASTLDFPARTIFMAEVVSKSLLVNAMAFQRLAMDITQIAGPILGGAFIALFSFQGAYGLIVAAYVANVVVTIITRSPANATAPPAETASVWKDLTQGLSYIRTNRNAQGILLLAAAANFVGFTYSQTLLPVFARDVYKVGPLGLGLLMTAIGAGSLAASLALAAQRRSQGKGVVMLASFLLWPAMMALFALSPWYSLSLAILMGAGASQSLSMTTSTSLLLICVPEEMKGRVMGARALMIATLPLGNLMAGAGASVLGAPLTLGAYAAIYGSIVLAIALGYRGLRKME